MKKACQFILAVILLNIVVTIAPNQIHAEEKFKIRWAQGLSGNAMVTIAKEQGYFDEYGLEIQEIPLEGPSDTFSALNNGQCDIVSNEGTNAPLQNISAGNDLMIFGGHMVAGAMPIIAPAGTKWNGVEDLLGKKVAGSPTGYYISGPLLDKGYDPANEITWLEFDDDKDKVMAVATGEADYGVIGTNQNYAISLSNEVEVMAYLDDVLPNYSCCRMVTRRDFFNDNKEEFKNLHKALLKATKYFYENKDEVVQMTMDKLGANREYVEAYIKSEHYIIHPDPLKKPVLRAWDWLGQLGILDARSKDVNIEDHLDNEVYLQALTELIDEVPEDQKAWYQEQMTYFEENNLD